MARIMAKIELSEEQRDAMLKFCDTESDIEFMSVEVVQQLMNLGLVYKRASDGHFDFTDLGESAYDDLTSQ